MSIKERISGLRLNYKFTVLILVIFIIPLAVFTGVLFNMLEKNVIVSNVNSMEYKRDQSTSNIQTCIDSINMATQFFLSDQDMKDVLVRASEGDELTTEELVRFQEGDITNLERLVSNNPLLYSVRIFAENDNVQEMMQILYKNKRKQNLQWLEDDNETGWHFGYVDTAFSPLLTNQNEKLICMVSSVTDFRAGKIGVIEASVKMSTFFPSLYENSEKEFSCFVTDDGKICTGRELTEDEQEKLTYIMSSLQKSEDLVEYCKLGREKLVVGQLYEKELHGRLLFIRDISGDVGQIYFYRNLFVATAIVLVIAIAFLINHIVEVMLKQLYSIVKSVREVQYGNLDSRIERTSNDEIGELGSQLNTMLDRIQELMTENIEREVLIKDSEIRALQNQINAHFIYNVLESIKMMAEIDEEYEISDSITSLGKLLRYSMKWVSGNVTVEEELDYIKNYMALINLRNDFVVNLSTNIPENLLTQQIPKMSLQPVVENAIIHGIDPLGVDSTIYIKGKTDGKDFVLEVTDSGTGMNDEQLELLEKKIAGLAPEAKGKGNGIGLHNVQNRIKLTFGDEYGMTVASAKDCYTKVTIRLPYVKK